MRWQNVLPALVVPMQTLNRMVQRRWTRPLSRVIRTSSYNNAFQTLPCKRPLNPAYLHRPRQERAGVAQRPLKVVHVAFQYE
jgi:hypothetical protein